jgi:hypothetical protein
MRFYQTLYDPTAHFLTAWLPAPQDVYERNSAELTRHPQKDINITIEVMLRDADDALRAGNYNRSNVILDSIERVLIHNGTFLDPLGNNYLSIVQELLNSGYQVQQIDLQGNQATAQVTLPNNPTLSNIRLVLNNQSWILTQ